MISKHLWFFQRFFQNDFHEIDQISLSSPRSVRGFSSPIRPGGTQDWIWTKMVVNHNPIIARRKMILRWEWFSICNQIRVPLSYIDVGDGFGRFCHRNPWSYNISVGHQHPTIVTNIKIYVAPRNLNLIAYHLKTILSEE